MPEAKFEESEYLSFLVDGTVCAFPVSQVREVLEYAPVTKVPDAPEAVLGIVNVRGAGIPVIDLRSRFALPPVPDPTSCHVIVTESGCGGNRFVAGVLVDSVDQVEYLGGPGEGGVPKEYSAFFGSEFVAGIRVRKDGFIIALEVEKVVAVGSNVR